ncbi:hypothetical protein BV898_16658 [Hypsibius exemplaris]|uniref:Transmembrane protein n=1 Tax=Hypsibius exemplaris TaxID=2072580 RepID=A0A9X6NFA6_HYPEX|nr:hypothetical protein BV898_16658 [Hypsibius exemplaris]
MTPRTTLVADNDGRDAPPPEDDNLFRRFWSGTKFPILLIPGLLQISAGILVITQFQLQMKEVHPFMYIATFWIIITGAMGVLAGCCCSERIFHWVIRDKRRCIKLPYMRVSISCLGLYRNMMLLGAFFMCIGLDYRPRLQSHQHHSGPADPFAHFPVVITPDGEKDFNLYSRVYVHLDGRKVESPASEDTRATKTASVVLCVIQLLLSVGVHGMRRRRLAVYEALRKGLAERGINEEDADLDPGETDRRNEELLPERSRLVSRGSDMPPRYSTIMGATRTDQPSTVGQGQPSWGGVATRTDQPSTVGQGQPSWGGVATRTDQPSTVGQGQPSNVGQGQPSWRGTATRTDQPSTVGQGQPSWEGVASTRRDTVQSLTESLPPSYSVAMGLSGESQNTYALNS